MKNSIDVLTMKADVKQLQNGCRETSEQKNKFPLNDSSLIMKKHFLLSSAGAQLEMILKNISILGLGDIPNKRRKTDEKNYEQTVNRHNLKMRFLQKWVPARPACQVCERLKIGAKRQAEFASVYTFALLAKNVIA